MALNISNWFEYPTNYSNGTSVDGLGSFVQWADMTVAGSLGTGIILLIWVASFVMSLVAGSRKALATSSFIALVFSIYLYAMEIVSPIVIIILLALLIIGVLGSKSESGGL